jgi:hypothetical protein
MMLFMTIGVSLIDVGFVIADAIGREGASKMGP